jgi:hypothetical protein
MKTRAALLLALPVLLLATASCRVDNRASVDVQAICFPGTDCKFGPTCDKQIIGNVTMDLGLTPTARVFLQVSNRLVDNGDKSVGRTNTNDAHIDQVAVEYSGLPVPGVTYDVSNQWVPTGGSAVIGIDAVHATLPVYSALAAAVPAGGSGVLVAKIRLKGYFSDGSRFETGEFPTAIDVCNGCLSPNRCGVGTIACPMEGMDPISCGTTGG